MQRNIPSLLTEDSRGDLEILANQRRSKRLKYHQKLSLVIALLDSLVLAAIFAFFVTESLHDLLKRRIRFYLFPAAAFLITAHALLSDALIFLEDRFKTGTIIKGVVDTLVAIAVMIAVGGGILAEQLFGKAPPVIFAFTFGFKTLFQAMAAMFNSGKSVSAYEETAQERFLQRAIGFGIGTLIGITSTIATVLVMIMERTQFAGLGIFAGLLGAGSSLYHLGKKDPETTITRQVEEQELLLVEHQKEDHSENKQSTSAQLTKALSSGLVVAMTGEVPPGTEDRKPDACAVSKAEDLAKVVGNNQPTVSFAKTGHSLLNRENPKPSEKSPARHVSHSKII